MKQETDIDTWMRCWAALCRGVQVNLGYPKQVPWYTQPLNYADDSGPDVLEYDWLQGQKIVGIVDQINRHDPASVDCLKAKYAAMPNPQSKDVRFQRARERHVSLTSDREVYRNADKAQARIEGALWVGEYPSN